MESPIKTLFLCVSLLLTSCAGTAHKEVITAPVHIKDSFMFVQKSVFFEACFDQKPVPKGDPKQKSEKPCVNIHKRATGSGWIAANVKTSNGQWDSIGMTAGHVCETRVKEILLVDPETKEKKKVLFKSKEIRVSMLGGKTYRAEIVKIYDYIDVCVLRIEGVKLPYLKTSTKAPVYGEKVFNIAAPRGIYSPTLAPFFEGRYVGRDTIGSGKMRGLMDLYSIPTTFGSSGSPIVNTDGEVVGLVSMAIIGFENLGISPPYESLRDILLSVQEQ